MPLQYLLDKDSSVFKLSSNIRTLFSCCGVNAGKSFNVPGRQADDFKLGGIMTVKVCNRYAHNSGIITSFQGQLVCPSAARLSFGSSSVLRQLVCPSAARLSFGSSSVLRQLVCPSAARRYLYFYVYF